MISDQELLRPKPLKPRLRHAILIYNPAARRVSRGQSDLLHMIRQRLGDYGFSLQLLVTEQSHHAILLAKKALEDEPDLIIVAGGDGTVNEVITGMAGTRVPLLVLPGGTANVLAKEIGLPHDLLQSIDLLKTGTVRRIALGKAGERYFALMAGIGVDASIVAAVSPRLKQKFGQGAFWIAGLRQFCLYPFPAFEIATEESLHRGTFAVIARARSYGGPFSIASRADLFSDKFDICIYQSKSRWRYLSYLFFTALGRHVFIPDIQYLSAERVEARGNPGVWFQVDGELVGRLPQRFTIEKDALSLILPSSATFNQPFIVR
jgi:diacylglycerol kinase (ATP)